MNGWLAAVATFLASGVECVEAATIVLAVGYTAGWRIALRATGWAVLVLILLVGVFGPALVRYVPLGVLKIAIGAFLLLFGFTWLRKAIWRAAGKKALHDEEQIFEKELRHLRQAHSDKAAFATAFNGVLLEGLEVAVIVLTFAAAQREAMYWAAAGAIVAALAVTLAAVMLRRPLARVPENAMAFAVGIMLVSFGTFWSGEGLGMRWPSGDLSLFAILAAYVLAAYALVVVRRDGIRAG